MQKQLFNKSYLSILLMVITIMLSCNHPKSFTNKNELLSYLNKGSNGYSQEILSNNVSIKLTYQPTSLMVQNELDEQVQFSKKVIDSLQKKYEGSYYFHLEFSKNGKEAIRQMDGFTDYSVLLQTLAFQMGDHIVLTTHQKDTVALGDYYFDQTYGMSSSNRLLISFDRSVIKKSDKLKIHIGECGFGTGDVKFEFERDRLDNAPWLKQLN
ncbi:hypothetical protein IQ13_0900 [Lacibacter cauensis]|uniref:Uncharacterized protein n=1 Tax=Lacibacter cauensis TaxID=510947 RepID=A0A562SWR7_9BACT|nr:hypothetical protein [Lacibacter cauensis]TWI85735.1 hypothetical protein IQ13_0900 [Lacibacter cauensis]